MATAANETILKLVSEFTDTPGPRYKHEGDFSGEEFREKVLVPRFIAASESGQLLIVDLDGAQGYPTSFLEEAFGGLARIYGTSDVEKYVRIKSDDEPLLTEEIGNYIRDAKQK